MDVSSLMELFRVRDKLRLRDQQGLTQGPPWLFGSEHPQLSLSLVMLSPSGLESGLASLMELFVFLLLSEV